MARRAPGMVLLALGWVDSLRRESTEEISGHRQRRFLCRTRQTVAVAGITRCGALLDRCRHPDLPGRQSAHQAAAVLALADRRYPLASPRRGVPVGGIYQAGGHVSAGQA